MLKIPNWADCELRVEGKTTELKKFKKFARGRRHKENDTEVLHTDNFIPYPKKYMELDKKAAEWQKKNGGNDCDWTKKPKDGFNSGGYEWCIKNWGTKWGICRPELVSEDYKWGELFYTFESAWSPPEPVIKKMARMFPKLDFTLKYFEQGACFHGILRIEKGKVTENKCTEYYGAYKKAGHGLHLGYGNRHGFIN